MIALSAKPVGPEALEIGEMNKLLAIRPIIRKVAFTAALVAAFALGGCGAPEAAPSSVGSPAPSSATATPSPNVLTVSEKTTCTLLIGPEENGPLIQYINGVTAMDPSDKAAIAELATTRDEIKEISKRSVPEMKELLAALFSTDLNDFKAAGVELLTRC